jgi:hypothetical protein
MQELSCGVNPPSLFDMPFFMVHSNFAAMLHIFLFNDAVSSSDCVTANDRMVVNNEIGRMWKNTVVACFKPQSLYVPGWIEENCKNPVRIVFVPAEIRTGHLWNTSQNRNRLTYFPRWVCVTVLALTVIHRGLHHWNTRYCDATDWKQGGGSLEKCNFTREENTGRFPDEESCNRKKYGELQSSLKRIFWKRVDSDTDSSVSS